MLALSVMFFCVEGAILQFRFLVFALYFRFVSTVIDKRAALKMSCLQASTDALLFLPLLYCMSPPLTFKLIVRIYSMARKGTASCPFFCCSWMPSVFGLTAPCGRRSCFWVQYSILCFLAPKTQRPPLPCSHHHQCRCSQAPPWRCIQQPQSLTLHVSLHLRELPCPSHRHNILYIAPNWYD